MTPNDKLRIMIGKGLPDRVAYGEAEVFAIRVRLVCKRLGIPFGLGAVAMLILSFTVLDDALSQTILRAPFGFVSWVLISTISAFIYLSCGRSLRLMKRAHGPG